MNPHLRRRILAEWRGLPQSDPRPDRTVSIGEAVGKTMAALGLDERMSQAQVVKAWKEIVGEFVAAHSAPTRLSRGVLIVSVLQPTVHFELERHWKKEIVQKLKARFGARMIREVKFRIG